MRPSRISVDPVTTGRETDAFLTLPWRIYRHDPAWVPPLLSEARTFIDPHRHPFYRHGTAVQLLARRDGQAVGRIMASDDPRYNAEHGTNVGCFGQFESVDDADVASSLLDAAAAWLRGRGRTAMMGPIDYSTNYACGLLVDGFDTPPRLYMNHNPPYYAGLLERRGLVKAKDLYAWWIDRAPPIEAWQRRVDRLARQDITIRPMRLDDLEAEMGRCKLIYQEAWQRNWGFVMLTDAELDDYANHLARIADPNLLLIAERAGEPLAFSITLPDLNEAIRPLDGRLMRWGLPIGLLRLAWRMRHIRTCRVFTLGIRPAYRRRGIAEALILQTLRHARDVKGYTGAEMGWTLEDNEPINRPIRAVGGHSYKTYRIYQTPI